MSKNSSEIHEFLNQYQGNKVKLGVVDIDGVLRGKYVHVDKFKSIIEAGFGFCDVIFGWDMTDVSYESVAINYTGWHTGYPDAPVEVDLSTFRKVPWENDVPFFLGNLKKTPGKDVLVCPRSLLIKVVDEATDLGLVPYFSQEFEWFNYKENPDTLAAKGYNSPSYLTPGMFGYSILRSSYKSDYFNDLFDQLELFDIELEGLHTETGPGVYEAAIKYTEALEAADRAVLFKTSVKEIAYKHDIIPTFMAKVDKSLPGCSGHIHQSLWDEARKKNLFYAGEGMSDLFRSYIAGQLFCLPHILPMLAPTINSYKRLVEGAWAPTTLTWGIDNRTVALRVLPGSEKSTRLETRVPGSDANPYLAMAACLAAGLYGIRNKLTLDQQMTTANGYEDREAAKLPHSLLEASTAMKDSAIAKELFGSYFVEHFTATRLWECKQYAKAVTNWEMQRYFEII